MLVLPGRNGGIAVTDLPLASPRITIQQWSAAVRHGEPGVVSFLLTVPVGRAIVAITAALTSADGQRFESVLQATNANVASGLLLPTVPPGTYALTLHILDDRGGSDTTAVRREVVVKP